MCKKRNFAITVSGEKDGKEKIIGSLVANSGNLTTEFGISSTGVKFFFRYRGDARFLLKRIQKLIGAEKMSDLDTLTFLNANARIVKLS